MVAGRVKPPPGLQLNDLATWVSPQCTGGSGLSHICMEKRQKTRYMTILNRCLLCMVEFLYYKYRIVLKRQKSIIQSIRMNYCTTFPFSNANSNSDLDHKYTKRVNKLTHISLHVLNQLQYWSRRIFLLTAKTQRDLLNQIWLSQVWTVILKESADSFTASSK